jgi:hypothetical protein
VPLVLSIQGVINPCREVKGYGYTPLLRDRLSFVKRQFVEGPLCLWSVMLWSYTLTVEMPAHALSWCLGMLTCASMHMRHAFGMVLAYMRNDRVWSD